MRTILASFVLSMLPVVALAEPFGVKCAIKGSEGGDLITPTYFFFRDPGSSEVMVYDAYVHQANDEEPMAVEIKSEAGGTLKLFWRITVKTNMANRYRVQYNAELDRSRRRVQIAGSVIGHRASNFRRGTCTPL